jgi:hypothetical protein
MLATIATVAALTLFPVLPAAPAPVDCTVMPYGTTGCEAHLGAVARSALVRERGVQLAGVTDTELGETVAALCFDRSTLAVSMTDAAARDITFNLRTIREVAVPKFCG